MKAARGPAPRLRELWAAYPRVVTGMLLAIGLLLLTDLVLVYKRGSLAAADGSSITATPCTARTSRRA